MGRILFIWIPFIGTLFKILDEMIVYTFKFVKFNLNYNIDKMKKI